MSFAYNGRKKHSNGTRDVYANSFEESHGKDRISCPKRKQIKAFSFREISCIIHRMIPNV